SERETHTAGRGLKDDGAELEIIGAAARSSPRPHAFPLSQEISLASPNDNFIAEPNGGLILVTRPEFAKPAVDRLRQSHVYRDRIGGGRHDGDVGVIGWWLGRTGARFRATLARGCHTEGLAREVPGSSATTGRGGHAGELGRRGGAVKGSCGTSSGDGVGHALLATSMRRW
ncbi:hypothetical protein BDK51DRAFT_25604, partial [Blyttiomyces helicus]